MVCPLEDDRLRVILQRIGRMPVQLLVSPRQIRASDSVPLLITTSHMASPVRRKVSSCQTVPKLEVVLPLDDEATRPAPRQADVVFRRFLIPTFRGEFRPQPAAPHATPSKQRLSERLQPPTPNS